MTCRIPASADNGPAGRRLIPGSWMQLRFRKGRESCVVVTLLVAHFAAWAQTERTPPTGDLSLLKDAAQSIAAGDLKRAESALNVVLATAPDDFRGLNLLGIVRAEQQREIDAEKLFKRAIAIKPDFASAHVSLGMLFVQMSRGDEAAAQFQEALRLDDHRDDARAALVKLWRDQAHTAVSQNDPEKAMSFLLQARKASPKDADVLYDFGMVALRMSLFPDALQAFQQTLELRKDDDKALYALGRTQMALTNYEGAQATFNRYGQLHPADASCRYALGMTLEALQRGTEARAEFEKSIELQPAQTESYFQLGQIDLEAADFQSADRQFMRVLSRNAHHAGALTGEGRLKFQQKDYAGALEMLKKAVAAEPAMREAHYYLGMTYARMNRKEDSDKELATATQLEHEEVERNQNPLRIIDTDQSPPSEQKK
jgi:tetratricopeptide (TPR) repeat protein